MKLKDVISINKGIFASMGHAFPVYNKYMDVLLIAEYGNRLISPLLEAYLEDDKLSDDNLINLANLIHDYYKDNWHRIEDSLKLKYNVLDTFKTQSVTNTKYGSKIEDIGFINTENKESVYAFDSENPSDSAKNNQVQSRNLSKQNSGVDSIEINKSGYSNINPQKQIMKEIDLAKWDYMKSVFKDTIDLICLPIYGGSL